MRQIKPTITAGLALAALATGIGVVAATPASADTLYAGATPRSGNSAVKVRTGPGASYTAVGQVGTGQYVPCWYPVTADCNSGGSGVSTGSSYTCNGATSNRWLKVSWAGTMRYAALGCLNIRQIPNGADIVP
ncbi:hypothetical protein [Plantactinospora sp. B5E13]|uniref:hypothetical protein n=1 Tax=unclassified Plantactinospora TaxID=2631981 RepID=UPI00325E79C2